MSSSKMSCPACQRKSKIRISLMLQYFFEDRRSFSHIMLDDKFETVEDVQNYVKHIFGINSDISFSINNHFLPKNESADIIREDESILILPLKNSESCEKVRKTVKRKCKSYNEINKSYNEDFYNESLKSTKKKVKTNTHTTTNELNENEYVNDNMIEIISIEKVTNINLDENGIINKEMPDIDEKELSCITLINTPDENRNKDLFTDVIESNGKSDTPISVDMKDNPTNNNVLTNGKTPDVKNTLHSKSLCIQNKNPVKRSSKYKKFKTFSVGAFIPYIQNMNVNNKKTLEEMDTDDVLEKDTIEATKKSNKSKVTDATENQPEIAEITENLEEMDTGDVLKKDTIEDNKESIESKVTDATENQLEIAEITEEKTQNLNEISEAPPRSVFVNKRRRRVRKNRCSSSRDHSFQNSSLSEQSFSSDISKAEPKPKIHIRFSDIDLIDSENIKKDTLSEKSFSSTLTSAQNIHDDNTTSNFDALSESSFSETLKTTENNEKKINFVHSTPFDQTHVSKVPDIKITSENHSSFKDINLKQTKLEGLNLKLINKNELPKENQVIAFKIYQMTDSYEPTISDWIIGKVMDVSSLDREIKFQVIAGVVGLNEPKGKFHIEENGDGVTENTNVFGLNWNCIIEPQLIIM